MRKPTQQYTPWVCAALFVACALPLFFIDDNESEIGKLSAGFASLFLAGWWFSASWYAWQAGEIKHKHTPCTRKDHPPRFFAAITIILAAATGALAAAIWILFFKP